MIFARSIVGSVIGASIMCTPAAAAPTDYSGLGLNTKQVAALRAVEAKMDAQDRAAFEKLWTKAPAEMKTGLPKSVWFGLFKWSVTMATVGECSRFLDNSEIERLRHAWDDAKGKNVFVDGLIEAGDSAFQDGDAAGNDQGAPDEQLCAVALRSLQASNDMAVAELSADLERNSRSK
jgi:hypothetical protein